MQRQAGCVVSAGTLEGAARLGFERGVAAVLVDPSADRVARKGRFDLLRPVASVGEDATKIIFAAQQDIGGVRRDDVFVRAECHHAWHAAWKTMGGRVVAQSALGLVGHAVLQDLLILRRQRSLLSWSPGLGGI